MEGWSMKYKLEWNYKLRGKESIFFSSDWIDGERALETAEELEKTGKAADISF
jgi:ribonuclease HI